MHVPAVPTVDVILMFRMCIVRCVVSAIFRHVETLEPLNDRIVFSPSPSNIVPFTLKVRPVVMGYVPAVIKTRPPASSAVWITVAALLLDVSVPSERLIA